MRNHYKVAGLMSIVVVALSLIAAAQTSSQGSQPQSSPNAQSQSSSQGQAGSQQAAPQGRTETAPSAAPQGPGGSSAASQPAGNQPGSVEDELHLTDAQKQQLRPIIQEEMTQINAVRDDQSMSMDQKRAKVEQIRQTEFPKIQAILTPEQIQKLKDLQQKAHQQQQGGPGTAPPAQQPPQQPPH